jgi:hypothetical protein
VPADVSATATAAATLRFPQRKNASRADGLALQRERMIHNYGIQGVAGIFDSWEEFLEDRPVDVPFYTAPLGQAVIATLVSRASVPRAGVLAQIEQLRHPFALHTRAFLDAPYPLLRMNLLIPDNPADPLCLETSLDLRDGDAQDFIRALMIHRTADVVLAHEEDPSSVVVLPLAAARLVALLEREANVVVQALPPGADVAEVIRARRMLEQVFVSAFDGLTPEYTVALPRQSDSA